MNFLGKLFAIPNVDSRMGRRSSGSHGVEGKVDAGFSSQGRGRRPTHPASDDLTLQNGHSGSTTYTTNNALEMSSHRRVAEFHSDYERDDRCQKATRSTEKATNEASISQQVTQSSSKQPRTLKLKVLMLKRDFIIAAKDNNNDQIRIEKSICPTDYPLRRGDWLRVQLKPSSDGGPNKLPDISQVDWVEINESDGIVTQTDGLLCIDDRIYVVKDDVQGNRPLQIGDRVHFISVSSDQWNENILERGRRPRSSGQSTSFRYKRRALTVTLQERTSSASKPAEEAYRPRDEKIKRLLESKNRIKITPSRELDLGSVVVGSTASGEITVQNNSRDDIMLTKVEFWKSQSVCEFKADFKLPEEQESRVILSKDAITVKIECKTIGLGRTEEMCVLDFGSDIRIGLYILANSTTEFTDLVNNNTSDTAASARERELKRVERTNELCEDKCRKNVRGPRPTNALLFTPIKMQSYEIPQTLAEIFKTEDYGRLQQEYPINFFELTPDNFVTRFKISIWLEELERELQRKEHDLKDVVMVKENDHLVLEVPDLGDMAPAVTEGDKIACIVESVGEEKYTATIQKIVYRKYESPKLHLQFHERFHQKYKGTPVGRIHFCMGRKTFIRQHFAVEHAMEYLGSDWLFPDTLPSKPPRIAFSEVTPKDPKMTENGDRMPSGPQGPSRSTQRLDSAFEKNVQLPPKESVLIQWRNEHLNEEQKAAVRQILWAEARPLPYIIFGPPGTGKTVTLVESILQVYFMEKTSRILVAVPSNAAADLITQRLVETRLFIPGDFIRFNGFLRTQGMIPDNIVDFCEDGTQLDVISKYRLMVCTTNTAGQFFQISQYTGHFSHVFIDEAGYATEPDTLIPCVLAAVNKEAVLVMAGDPHQLGPVLANTMKINKFMKTSLLERLMKTKLYQSDNEYSVYNPALVTKLVRNYRCHPLLLQVPSKLFYSNELEPFAGPEVLEFCGKNLKFLPNPEVPLVFHGVRGAGLRDKDSPSRYNMEEVSQIYQYVLTLRNHGVDSEEIGIITPYKKQVEKIRSVLRQKFRQEEIPKIASVQEFQGGERKVIIVSTVRSEYENVAKRGASSMEFIYSPKLFNVAITRAKALLIIIGDPHVLYLSRFWGQLLEFCVRQKAYTGCDLPKYLNSTEQNELKGLSSDSESDTDSGDSWVDGSPGEGGGYRTCGASSS